MAGQQGSWRLGENATGGDDSLSRENDDSGGRPWRRGGNQRWGPPSSGQVKREQSRESLASSGSGSRDALPDRDMRDRVLYSLISLVGKRVVVRLKGGLAFKGVFDGAETEGSLGIVLKSAERIRPPVEEGEKPDIRELLVVGSDEFAELIAEEMFLDCGPKRSPRKSAPFSGVRSPEADQHSERFHLDSDLAGSKNREGKSEKVLERWVPDNTELSHASSLDLDRGGASWDQFEVNKRLYGVESTWNEDLYTKKLDKTQVPHHVQREAARLAREIERQKSSNVHMLEERGQIQAKEDYADLDEEARYSAVARNQEEEKTKQPAAVPEKTPEKTSAEPEPQLSGVPLLKTLGGLKAISNLNPNARDWAPTAGEKSTSATTSSSQAVPDIEQLPHHSTLHAAAPEFVPGHYSSSAGPANPVPRVDPPAIVENPMPILFVDMCFDAFTKKQRLGYFDHRQLTHTWPSPRARTSSQMAEDDVYATTAYGGAFGQPMSVVNMPYVNTPMPVPPGSMGMMSVGGRGRGLMAQAVPGVPLHGGFGGMRMGGRVPMPSSSTGPTPPRGWGGYPNPSVPNPRMSGGFMSSPDRAAIPPGMPMGSPNRGLPLMGDVTGMMSGGGMWPPPNI